MTSTAPKLLYKYMAPERADVLFTEMLRFTPPAAFNDPFDGRVTIQDLHTDVGLAAEVVDQVERTNALIYADLPAWMRIRMTRRMFDIVDEPYRAKRIIECEQKIRDGLGNIPKTPIQPNNIGVLCLTETATDPLMWAHYGAQHGGFVLGFDSTHEFFLPSFDRASFEPQTKPQPVHYSDTPPVVTSHAFATGSLYYHKSKAWAYEQEWRMFRKLSEADLRIESQPLDIHLFKYPVEALKTMVLGARSTQESRDAIYEALKKSKVFRRLHISFARLSPNSYDINLVDAA
jgi:hypothetical protein